MIWKDWKQKLLIFRNRSNKKNHVRWTPMLHSIIKDKNTQYILHEIGYHVAGNIGIANILALKELYRNLHDFKSKDGGMFYSLYSKDIEYRKKVNDEIEKITQSIYDQYFVDYKSIIHSFIVKIAGPKSDFTLHQDSTGLDENIYSPLSIWIPLQDTDIKNGTLCVIPKTHGFFHRYRGISFASPFKDYEDELRKYLLPLVLNAGDILLFDNRLVHYSHVNNSNCERIVVMSGLFPKDADILTIYKDEDLLNSPIEIFKQSEDFLITNTAFFENCTARPYRGEVIEKIYDPLAEIKFNDFLSWAKKVNLQPTNISQLTNVDFNMNIISEPV